LSRTPSVRKSAIQAPADRPTLDHHRWSLRLSPERAVGIPRVVLVDDVSSNGTTMLACASVLRESLPAIEISGFAVGRTERDTADLARVIDPRWSRIRLSGYRAQRVDA
jgi:hypothetical protein